MRNDAKITVDLSFAYTVGSSIAAVISYTAWHSIPWAILHSFLGWIYVLYYAIKY